MSKRRFYITVNILLFIAFLLLLIDRFAPFENFPNVLPVNLSTMLICVIGLIGMVKLNNRLLYSRRGGDVSKFKVLSEFIDPFYKNKIQRLKLSYLVLIVLIVPLAIVLLSYNGPLMIAKYFNFGSKINPVLFWSLWLTVVSILITSRVYFEITYKSKHDLNEFLLNVTEFLHETRSQDEIYIVLPTLYIGARKYPRFYSRFKEKIIEVCKDQNKPVNIAILSYADGLVQFQKEYNELSGALPEEARLEIEQTRFLDEFYENDNSPLKIFHSNWFPYERKMADEWHKYFYEMYEFMSDIEELHQEANNKIHLKKMNKDYFSRNGIVGLGRKDFFMFANVTSGTYYIGDVSISSQTSIFFEGTIFRNEHVQNGFTSLYAQFVKGKIN